MRGPCLRLAAVMLCLSAGFTGCRHKVQTLQVPHTQAPSLNTSNITVITPLPSVPATAKPSVEPAMASKPTPQPPPQPEKKHFHRHHKEKHPAVEVPAVSPPVTAQVESEPRAQEASAAQWSTGTALDPKQRAQMFVAIQAQERRIGNVKDATAGDRQTLLAQVKLFLQKARASVASNDLDGATTLTTKARVLLDELQGVEP